MQYKRPQALRKMCSHTVYEYFYGLKSHCQIIEHEKIIAFAYGLFPALCYGAEWQGTHGKL